MARIPTPDLAALADLARSFARAYPALAPRLSEASADPDVERLLDAFAYLTEHVHRVLDEGAPAAAQLFGDVLSPELDRPFPASAIVELSAPRFGGRVTVGAGAEMESAPIDGTRCRFRAWSSFDVVPWSVERAEVVWSPRDGHVLELALEASTSSGYPADWLASLLPLRLYLSADSQAARTLLLYLNCHLESIELAASGGEGASLGLGNRVRPWGLASHEALLPPEPFEHPGIRLLREYFVLPAKLAFVEVPAPTTPIVAGFIGARRVVLRFRFGAELPPLALVAGDVRVNCVPVANVFETTTDPVRVSLERPEAHLRPAGMPLGHGEIYAVSRVLARLDGRRGLVPIAPFADFEAAPEDSLEDVFFVTRTTASPASESAIAIAIATGKGGAGHGREVRLSLGSPVGSAPVPEMDFLSIEVLATNGALPSALRGGDICHSTESTPRGLSLRNVGAVASHVGAPRGAELHRRTLALATLSALPITRVDTLRTLLDVMNLRPLVDAQEARAHSQKLAAIEDVRVTPGRARGAATGLRDADTTVVGHDVHITLSAAGFDGEADALVFASVLARFFAHEATMGTFVRVTVTLRETGRVLAFPALHGDIVFANLPEGSR